MPILEVSLYKHHHKIGDANRTFDEKFQEGSLVVQTSLETSQFHRFDWSHDAAVYPQERRVTIELPETLAVGYSEHVVGAVLTAVVGYLREYLRHHNQWQGTESLILSDYRIANAAQPKTVKISPQMYKLLSDEFIGRRAVLPKLPDTWGMETLGEVVSGEGFDYKGCYDGVIQTQMLESTTVLTHQWRVYDTDQLRLLNLKVDDRLTYRNYRDEKDRDRVALYDEQHYSHVLYRLREQLYEFGLLDKPIRVRFVESLAHDKSVKNHATTRLLEKIAKHTFIQEYEPRPRPSQGKRLDDLQLTPRLTSHVAKYSVQQAESLNGPQKITTHIYNHGYVNQWQAEVGLSGTRILLMVNLHGALVAEPEGQAVLGTCLHALFNGIQEELKKRFAGSGIEEVFSLRFLNDSVDYDNVPRGVIQLMQECVIAHFGERCTISFNKDFNHKHTQTSPAAEKAAWEPVVAPEAPSETTEVRDPFMYSTEVKSDAENQYVCGYVNVKPFDENDHPHGQVWFVVVANEGEMFVTWEPRNLSVSPENADTEMLMRGCIQQLRKVLEDHKLLRLVGGFFLPSIADDSTGRIAMELDRWSDELRKQFVGKFKFVKLIGLNQAEKMFLHHDAETRQTWSRLFNAVQNLHPDVRLKLYQNLADMAKNLQPQPDPQPPKEPSVDNSNTFDVKNNIANYTVGDNFEFRPVITQDTPEVFKGTLQVYAQDSGILYHGFDFVIRPSGGQTIMLHLLHWAGLGTPDDQRDELFHGLLAGVVACSPWSTQATSHALYITAPQATHPVIQDWFPLIQSKAKRVFGDSKYTVQLVLDMSDRATQPEPVAAEVKRVEPGNDGELPTVVVGPKSDSINDGVVHLNPKSLEPVNPDGSYMLGRQVQSEEPTKVFPAVVVRRRPSGCVHFDLATHKTVPLDMPERGYMVHTWHESADVPKQLVIELDPTLGFMARVAARQELKFDPLQLLQACYLAILLDVQDLHGETSLKQLYSTVLLRVGSAFPWVDAASDGFLAAAADLDYWRNFNVVSTLNGAGASEVKIRFEDPNEPRAQDVPHYLLHSCAFDYVGQAHLKAKIALVDPATNTHRTVQIHQTPQGFEIRPFLNPFESDTAVTDFHQSPRQALANLHGVVKQALMHYLAIYRVSAAPGGDEEFKLLTSDLDTTALVAAYGECWLFEALKKEALAFLSEAN